MSIIKKLENRIDLFNQAIIEKLFENGATICTLQQVEEAKDSEGNPILDEDGKPVINVIKQDSNIGFPADFFEFSQSELDELNPPQVNVSLLDGIEIK